MTAVLAILLLAAIFLTLAVSVWFMVPVPLLAAACYGAAAGLSPQRFTEALDDAGSGTGTTFPF